MFLDAMPSDVPFVAKTRVCKTDSSFYPFLFLAFLEVPQIIVSPFDSPATPAGKIRTALFQQIVFGKFTYIANIYYTLINWTGLD